MKPRPRQAENRVAEILSDFFSSHGLSPVERIPILGREGPDLTLNEARLVIDVKSRQTCPKGFFDAVQRTGKAAAGEIAIFRLDALSEALVENQGVYNIMRNSKTVNDWLVHMDEWMNDNISDGIPAVIIHQPNLPYGNAVLVMYQSDVGLLRERINHPDTIGHGQSWVRFVDKSIHIITPVQEYVVNLDHEDIKSIEKWINNGK